MRGYRPSKPPLFTHTHTHTYIIIQLCNKGREIICPVGYLSLLLSLYHILLFNLTKCTIFMDDNKPLCYVMLC